MAMNQSDALDAIAALLDGQEWSPDTLDDIARILRDAGYEIRDCNDIEEGDDEEGDDE